MCIQRAQPMLYHKLSRLVNRKRIFAHGTSSHCQNVDPFENQPQPLGAIPSIPARPHARTQHRHFVKSSFNAIKQSFFLHYIFSCVVCFVNLYATTRMGRYHVGFCR